jgi:hypothetical protein
MVGRSDHVCLKRIFAVQSLAAIASRRFDRQSRIRAGSNRATPIHQMQKEAIA